MALKIALKPIIKNTSTKMSKDHIAPVKMAI
jgi:hypothetical protein